MTASHLLQRTATSPAAVPTIDGSATSAWPPRRLAWTALWLGLAAGVAWVLLPRLGGLVRSIQGLELVEPAWVIVGAALVVLRYAAAAASLQASTTHRIPFLPTLLVQLSSSFVGRLTPEGLGWFVLNQRYLERAGLPRPTALAAITLKLVAGGVGRLLIALVVAAQVGASAGLAVRLPEASPALAIAVLGASLVVLVIARTASPLASRARSAIRPAARDVAAVARQPRRAVALLTTTAALTLLSGLALAASVAAFGVDVPLLQLFAVYLGGTALAALSPTPGNLGAVELALSAGLTAIGVPAAAALGSVLVYRLLTFWLPVVPGLIAFRLLQRQGWL